MNKNDIEQALRDYFWMPKEIERLSKALREVDTSLTASYGEESALPKPHGETIDKVGNEVVKRDRRHRQIDKLKKKIECIDESVKYIKDDREKAVLFCLMDGMSLVGVSQHLGISERTVGVIKGNVIDKIHKHVGNVADVGNVG